MFTDLRCSTVLLLAALMLPADAVAGPVQDPPGARVDSLFAQYDRPGSPGAAVAVARRGEIVFARGYGLANLEYDIPITPKTIFHIASISKQFVAYSLLLLEQQGVLSLDDEVHRWVPELADFGTPITIRHLLHHTSGLRDQWELLQLAGWRMDDVITTDHIMELVRGQRELNFEPGTEHLYCNTGYTLGAVIVERASGLPLPAFARLRIFAPLGMTRTHFHDDHRLIVPGRAYSYSPAGPGTFRHAVLSYATVGATSLFTTVEDLARWDANFYELTLNEPDLLERFQSRGRLRNGREINYALGLSHGTYRGYLTVGHGGSDAGYRTHLLRFPEQELTVIVLGNVSTFNASRAAQQVADIYLPPAETTQVERPAPTGAPPTRTGRGTEPVPSLSEEEWGVLDGLLFRLTDGSHLEVSVARGRLVLEGGGLPRTLLAPSAGDRFTSPEEQVTAIFSRNSEGDITRLTLRQGERSRNAVRTRRLDEAGRAAYTGSYLSRELDVAWQIVAGDEGLVLRRRKFGDTPLIPGLGETFTAGRYTIVFERVGERLTGFRLTSGRVRNLLFERRLPGS